MRFISFEEAVAQAPGERMYAFDKHGDTITLLADIEENLNLESDEEDLPYPNDFRVELFGWHGEAWTLDNEELLASDRCATGEERGRRAGGIAFDYEDPEAWEDHVDAYHCLKVNVPSAHAEVAVIDRASELFDLEDGEWIVVTSSTDVLL